MTLRLSLSGAHPVPPQRRLRGLLAGVALAISTTVIAGVAQAVSAQPTPTDPIVRQAEGHLAAEEYHLAARFLQQSLRDQPDRADLWFLFGASLEPIGKPAEALTAYTRSIELSPDNPSAWWAKGLLLSGFDRFEEAAEMFARCVELYPPNHPTRAQALLNLGTARLLAGDAAGALEPLTRTAATVPNAELPLTYRLRALRQLERYDEGVDDALRVLAEKPGYAPLWHELSLIHAAAGRDAEAREALDRAAAIDPPYPAASVDLARTLAANGTRDDLVGAAAHFRRAIAADPDFFGASAELAQVYLQLGLRLDAGDAAERALDERSIDPEVLLLTGNALLQAGRAEKALQAFERALATSPDDAWLHHHNGLALHELQRSDEARAAFAKAVELDPDLLPARIQAGRVALAMADPAGAVAMLEPVVSSALDEPLLLALLGKAYAQSGRYDDAIAFLKDAARLDPEMPDPPYMLAQAYRELGRDEEANVAMEEFQALSRADRQQRADDRQPDIWSQEAVLLRAQVYAAEGRHDEAIDALDRHLERQPDDVAALERLATILEAAGQAERAVRARQEIERLRIQSP